MTDNNNKNNTRLTLTLKNSLANIPVANKNTVNKNSVQVTIKGRKKESQELVNNSGQEIEARFLAIAKSQQNDVLESEQLTTHEILKKTIKKQSLDNQQSVKAEQKTDNFALKKDLQPNILQELPKNPLSKSLDLNDAKPQKQESKNLLNENNKLNIQPEISKKPQEAQKNHQQNQQQNDLINDFYKHSLDDFQIDAFDVRNKIKQSLQQLNQQKEDRQKVIEQKQKQQQVISAEKAESLKKKVKKSTENLPKPSENNDANKKNNL